MVTRKKKTKHYPLQQNKINKQKYSRKGGYTKVRSIIIERERVTWTISIKEYEKYIGIMKSFYEIFYSVTMNCRFLFLLIFVKQIIKKVLACCPC